MPISPNFPTNRPTLDLDFTRSKKLDSRLTFTRSSGGTCIGPDGKIITLGSDTPRFDHDPITNTCNGLLLEESRTNLLVLSNSFSTGGAGNWGAVGAVPVYTQNQTGPDGIVNGSWTIDDQSTLNDAAGVEQKITITPSTSTNYCLSIFAKKGTASYFEFYAFFTGTSTRGSFLRYNFDTDTITPGSAEGPGITPTIFGRIQYPNGWYRLYFVVNDANDGLNNTLASRIYPAGRSISLTGTTLFYGAQVEIGSFPTSYIPTTTATATRSADVLYLSYPSNVSTWYNQLEGTYIASVYQNTSAFSVYITNLLDTFYTNTPNLYILTSGLAVLGIGGVIGDSGQSVFTQANSKITIAGGWSSILALLKTATGGTVGSYIGYISPSVTNNLYIGLLLNSTLQKFSYYPQLLSDTQLSNLTKVTS
jgi:hypothetical protein